MSYEINFGPWGSIFAVPTAVADRYLKFCTEEQLKVLLLALRQGQGPVDTAGIAARLGMDEAAVTDCLQYWQESASPLPGNWLRIPYCHPFRCRGMSFRKFCFI